jgi:hypothetical protein
MCFLLINFMFQLEKQAWGWANLLVFSIFHETKIPTVDMKVQVYSKFRKIIFEKK